MKPSLINLALAAFLIVDCGVETDTEQEQEATRIERAAEAARAVQIAKDVKAARARRINGYRGGLRKLIPPDNPDNHSGTLCGSSSAKLALQEKDFSQPIVAGIGLGGLQLCKGTTGRKLSFADLMLKLCALPEPEKEADSKDKKRSAFFGWNGEIQADYLSDTKKVVRLTASSPYAGKLAQGKLLISPEKRSSMIVVISTWPSPSILSQFL